MASATNFQSLSRRLSKANVSSTKLDRTDPRVAACPNCTSECSHVDFWYRIRDGYVRNDVRVDHSDCINKNEAFGEVAAMLMESKRQEQRWKIERNVKHVNRPDKLPQPLGRCEETCLAADADRKGGQYSPAGAKPLSLDGEDFTRLDNFDFQLAAADVREFYGLAQRELVLHKEDVEEVIGTEFAQQIKGRHRMNWLQKVDAVATGDLPYSWNEVPEEAAHTHRQGWRALSAC